MGVLYIVGLGKDESVEPKFAVIGPTRWKMGPTMRPGSQNDVTKILGPFDIPNVSQSKKHAKTSKFAP
jgi:hypothetical protein